MSNVALAFLSLFSCYAVPVNPRMVLMQRLPVAVEKCVVHFCRCSAELCRCAWPLQLTITMAKETIYLCNFRVSVEGDWLCLEELDDVHINTPISCAVEDGMEQLDSACMFRVLSPPRIRNYFLHWNRMHRGLGVRSPPAGSSGRASGRGIGAKLPKAEQYEQFNLQVLSGNSSASWQNR